MSYAKAFKKITTEKKRAVVADWLKAGSLNLFGLPFSGKDTQCKLLAEWLKAPIIGGGDILRGGQNVPEHVRKIIDSGELAPTDHYLNIVTPYLSQPLFAGQPLLLSSLGRWYGEEQGILQAASNAGHPLQAVILLKFDEATVRKRWQIAQKLSDRSERADDAEHILDTRLDEFRNKTLPVIDFYRQKNLLIEVDGHQSVDHVQEEILEKLFHKATLATTS